MGYHAQSLFEEDSVGSDVTDDSVTDESVTAMFGGGRVSRVAAPSSGLTGADVLSSSERTDPVPLPPASRGQGMLADDRVVGVRSGAVGGGGFSLFEEDGDADENEASERTWRSGIGDGKVDAVEVSSRIAVPLVVVKGQVPILTEIADQTLEEDVFGAPTSDTPLVTVSSDVEPAARVSRPAPPSQGQLGSVSIPLTSEEIVGVLDSRRSSAPLTSTSIPIAPLLDSDSTRSRDFHVDGPRNEPALSGAQLYAARWNGITQGAEGDVSSSLLLLDEFKSGGRSGAGDVADKGAGGERVAAERDWRSEWKAAVAEASYDDEELWRPYDSVDEKSGEVVGNQSGFMSQGETTSSVTSYLSRSGGNLQETTALPMVADRENRVEGAFDPSVAPRFVERGEAQVQEDEGRDSKEGGIVTTETSDLEGTSAASILAPVLVPIHAPSAVETPQFSLRLFDDDSDDSLGGGPVDSVAGLSERGDGQDKLESNLVRQPIIVQTEVQVGSVKDERGGDYNRETVGSKPVVVESALPAEGKKVAFSLFEEDSDMEGGGEDGDEHADLKRVTMAPMDRGGTRQPSQTLPSVSLFDDDDFFSSALTSTRGNSTAVVDDDEKEERRREEKTDTTLKSEWNLQGPPTLSPSSISARVAQTSLFETRPQVDSREG
eukprot:gene7618-9760_t